jgi:hypothetical protein
MEEAAHSGQMKRAEERLEMEEAADSGRRERAAEQAEMEEADDSEMESSGSTSPQSALSESKFRFEVR